MPDPRPDEHDPRCQSLGAFFGDHGPNKCNCEHLPPRPDDLAAIRAEGRRLLAEATDGPWHQAAAAAWSGTNEDPDLVADCPLYADAIAIVWLRNHADALLADPAPEGLSEGERHVVERSRKLRQMGHRLMVSGDDLIGILDAHFPPSTSTEEGTNG